MGRRGCDRWCVGTGASIPAGDPGSLVPVAEQSKWVVITGSGRSGTSSVGGTLKRLGLHIPQPEVEADEKNPRGYYEPAWLAALLKDFMDPIPVRTIDSRPHAPQVAMEALAGTDIEDQLREWLRGLLDEPQVALKDTRAYWVYEMFVRLADELGAELTSLTMLRHPTEVVRSRDTAYLVRPEREVPPRAGDDQRRGVDELRLRDRARHPAPRAGLGALPGPARRLAGGDAAGRQAARARPSTPT